MIYTSRKFPLSKKAYLKASDKNTDLLIKRMEDLVLQKPAQTIVVADAKQGASVTRAYEPFSYQEKNQNQRPLSSRDDETYFFNIRFKRRVLLARSTV